MSRVLGLSGWKGSGKDTAADYLMQHHGYKKLSFASKLKDMVAQMYGVERSWLDDRDKKEMPLIPYPVIPTDKFTQEIIEMLQQELGSGYWTPRALCILEGSIKRAVYPNYWVLSTARAVLDNPEEKYVISDMRYESEARTLSLLLPESFTTVRINRFELIETTDPSERDLDSYKFDNVISNRGPVEDMYAQLDYIVLTSTNRK